MSLITWKSHGRLERNSMLLLIGILIVVASTSALAPFIYTIF